MKEMLLSARSRVRSIRLETSTPDILWDEDALPPELHALEEALRRGSLRTPELFPYPKDSGGTRLLCRYGPFEETIYDAAVEQVSRVVDPQLNAGVFAHRMLASENGAFVVESFVRAYGRFEGAMWDAYNAGFHVLGKSDIATFYESVDPHILTLFLQSQGVPQSAIRAISLICASTARAHPGLPQGPRASDLLANSMLLSADTAVLLILAGVYLRWSDDVRLFCLSERAAREGLEAFLEAIQTLGLRHNPDKTTVVGDLDSDELAKDMVLVSFAERVRHRDWSVADDLSEYLDELLATRAPAADVRRAVRLLGKCRNRGGVPLIVKPGQSLAPFATEVGPYLMEVGYDMAFHDELMVKATASPSDREELGRLGILRAISHCRAGGRSESDALLSLVDQDSIPMLNRQWAARAAGAVGTRGTVRLLRDRVGDDQGLTDPVARGLLVGYVASGGTLDEAFCNQIRSRRQRLRATVDFLEQSASLPSPRRAN